MNESSILVQAVYFNSIGVLQVNLSNLEDIPNLKILNKCEDGKLTIKLTNNNSNIKKQLYKFSIFISKSLSINFKYTKFIQIKNETSNLIIIRYHTVKNILNNDLLFDNLFSFTVLDCLSFKNELKNENLSNFKLVSIECLNCKAIVIESLAQDCKLISNFNYDYIGNLEMLSCHETDIGNIIPDLDEKLKKL